MATPANKEFKTKVTETTEVKDVVVEKPTKAPLKAAAPKPATAEVRDVVVKLTLVNPYTKVRAIPGSVTPKVVVDSWWECQVKAGLAEWK